jgi:hypothetical protein
MRNPRKLLPFLALLLLGAAGVNHGGGGGDPLAIQFLQTARLIQKANEAGRIDLGVDNQKILTFLDRAQASLEGQQPLIEFPDGDTVNCFGVQKLGCVDDQGVIHVARQGWEQAPPSARVEVTTMELIKVLGGANRYSIAESVARVLDFQKTAGPTELMDAETRPQVVSESVFTKEALTSINRALKIASSGTLIPQFDLTRDDGMENYASVSNNLLTGHCPIPNVERNYFISLLYGGPKPRETFKVVWSGTNRTVIRNVNAGDRLFVLGVTTRKDHCKPPREVDDFSQINVFGSESVQSEKPEGKPVDAYFWDWRLDHQPPTEKPGTMLRASEVPQGKDPRAQVLGDHRLTLEPCAREALNLAISKAAGDEKLAKEIQEFSDGLGPLITGTRQYQIESMYRLQAPGSPQASYVVNLMVGTGAQTTVGFGLAYSFLVKTRLDGSQCRVADVILH